MQELMNLLISYKLSPNQLMLLYCSRNNIRPSSLVSNLPGEIVLCIRDGWLTEDKKLTDKALHILNTAESFFKVNRKKRNSFDTEEFNKKLIEFRMIFPEGKLPTGKPARTNLNDLREKMTTFMMKNPQYDWDLILDATEYYVEHFRKQQFNFMKTAAYFIEKNKESELASYCEMLLEGGDVPHQTKSIYNVD